MSDESDDLIAQGEVQIRRAPRVGRFIVVGAAFGTIAALVSASIFPVDPQVGFGATFGYLVLYGIPTGVLLGAGVAVLLDRTATRRSATVIAGKMTVQAHNGERALGAAHAQTPDAGLSDAGTSQARSSDSGKQPRSDAGQG